MWSYSGNPASNALDEVRFLISDTDQSKVWTLQDEEIAYTLGLYSAATPVIGQNFLAAAVCAEAILGKFKSIPQSKRVGDLSLTWGTQFKYYEDAAYRLRQRAALQAVKPSSGGASRAEKIAMDSDPDRVAPAIAIDGMSMLTPTSSEERADSPSVGP